MPAAPAGKRRPTWIDIVPGAVVEADVKQHPASTGHFRARAIVFLFADAGFALVWFPLRVFFSHIALNTAHISAVAIKIRVTFLHSSLPNPPASQADPCHASPSIAARDS